MSGTPLLASGPLTALRRFLYRVATLRTPNSKERGGVPVASIPWIGAKIASVQPCVGENPTVLADLPSGYAVIGDVQFLPGYCVLLGKNPKAKALADLPRAERVQFLADVDLLATAMQRACQKIDPEFRRANISILGNTDDFVHAHIWPRYEWEPPELIGRPVWLYDLEHWHDTTTALGEQHAALRALITANLQDLINVDDVRVTVTV